MVLKLASFLLNRSALFENDVKMYGTQALWLFCPSFSLFENDVKMYGTQAVCAPDRYTPEFENDVKMYGTQARSHRTRVLRSLRMM